MISPVVILCIHLRYHCLNIDTEDLFCVKYQKTRKPALFYFFTMVYQIPRSLLKTKR